MLLVEYIEARIKAEAAEHLKYELKPTTANREL